MRKVLGPIIRPWPFELNNLAQLLEYTNRLAEAEPLMRRTLAIDERSLGPDHPSVARDLNNLAGLLHNSDRLVEAEPLYRRALAIDEKSLGPDHPSVARDKDNLAALLVGTNRLAEAEPLMRRALAINEKSLGPDHPEVAISLNNLAVLLESLNRLAEAEPLMIGALAIDEKSLGPDHPKVAIRLDNLAVLKAEQGDWVGASAFCVKAKASLTGTRALEAQPGTMLGKVLSAENRAGLRGCARILFHSNAISFAEGFDLAQWAMQNEAADALSSMAARFAKGETARAQLVRAQQDLTHYHEAAYRKLDWAAGQADAKAADTARSAIAEIEDKLKSNAAALEKVDPNFAALSSPKPLSIADVQTLLGEGQGLVLFLDLWQISNIPEETLVFAITKRETRWVSVPLGTRAIQDRVAALRCGLDLGAWKDVGRKSAAISPVRSQDLMPTAKLSATHFLSILRAPAPFIRIYSAASKT